MTGWVMVYNVGVDLRSDIKKEKFLCEDYNGPTTHSEMEDHKLFGWLFLLRKSLRILLFIVINVLVNRIK